MIHKTLFFYVPMLVFIMLTLTTYKSNANKGEQTLANWRFEQVKHLNGDSTSTVIVGQPLTAGDRGPAEPQPYVFDNYGNNNFLQTRGSKPSPNVFSDNVLAHLVNGIPNTLSLALKNGEYQLSFDRPLAYNDTRKYWTIEASLMCNLLGTEQVYLCKDGEFRTTIKEQIIYL